MKKILLLILRLAAGSVFIVSGFLKLTQPYQNFLAVIQRFEVVHGAPAVFFARVMPWVEFVGGVFLVLGFWTRSSTVLLWAMNITFIGVLSSALLRKLPIQECGCFGESLALPVKKTLLIDAGLWIVLAALFVFSSTTVCWGLDRFFKQSPKAPSNP